MAIDEDRIKELVRQITEARERGDDAVVELLEREIQEAKGGEKRHIQGTMAGFPLRRDRRPGSRPKQ